MNIKQFAFISFEILALIVVAFLAVVVTQATPRQVPTTVLESPPGNSEYHAGETVAIQSASTDANGVGRELHLPVGLVAALI